MLNKPIKIKKLAAFAMAVTFWMFTGSVFAQSAAQPEKKQAVQKPVNENTTLKSTSSKAIQKTEAEQKRVSADQARQSEMKAAEMKKKEEMAKSEATPKQSASPSMSNKAPQSQVANSSTQKAAATVAPQNNANVQKEWAVKKAKLEADMKAKGYSDEDISRKIASMESKMNLNNQTTK